MTPSPYLLQDLYERLDRPRWLYPFVGVFLLVLWMCGGNAE